MRLFRLEGKVPVECKTVGDILKRGSTVTRIKTDMAGEVIVSTVFLGVDYSAGNTKPLLFETMVHGGKHNETTVRSSTWEEAEKQHARLLSTIILESKIDNNENCESRTSITCNDMSNTSTSYHNTYSINNNP